MKATTNVDTAVNSPGTERGFVVATSTTVGYIDVTLLAGSYLSFQAIGAECDVVFVESVATPVVDPILLTASPIRTVGVARRLYIGVDKDMVVPTTKRGSLFLAHKALGVGTLRGLEA